MSEETKRDVFLQIAKENRDLRMYDPEAIEPKELIEQDYQDWIREYDAALPDDLPVIPQAVGEWLKNCKHDECDLVDAIVSSVNSIITSRRVTRWMEDHFETFARAWVLGVCRVEETGEIVKLEGKHE
ncbi:DUF1642 domain-containing protein [Lacticaseibacillus paracasei]|uniref:DUF1642 domain-containing protein n=1 Tax=Lacticaseibacillus paracasei TaxID=1597 RepID=UPI0021E9AEBA|nr:DUF1642 domain-containing protein [Lacticaseibacillus paracasei]UYI59104.1 DUF1642 domain-containing protein [Lacticaseibacillus paracasei]